MVETQIITRDVTNTRVINAMKRVPRHSFVGKKYMDIAYSDQPLPIGYNQTISQPYVVAYMTSALGLNSKSRVLEIGTGSGYQAAVLAEIAKEVFTVEVLSDLSKKAGDVLKQLNYRNIKLKVGNGRYGWKRYAPYSHIIVTAASEDIPKMLIDQLDISGKMIIPLGSQEWTQYLVLIRKTKEGVEEEKLLSVRFVPLITKSIVK